MKSVDISLHNYFFPNINEDGWKFISTMATLSLLLAIVWFPIGCVSIIITIWCFYSFRDPNRVTPVLSSAVVSPADGKIISISKVKGPDVLGLERKNFTKICIYCSIFDVCINRIPIKGRIYKKFYDPGKTFTKSFSKNDIGNERMFITLRHSDGLDFVLQQTATFCNKRIVTKIKNSDEFLTGQRFGFIRFGGYFDLFLPDKIEPIVCVGQKVVAGETIVADIKSDAPRIIGEIR